MTIALLVVDTKNFFLRITITCLPHVKTLVSRFQSCFLFTIFTQHGHSQSELTPPYKNQLVQKWGAAGFIATGSEDLELISDIAA